MLATRADVWHVNGEGGIRTPGTGLTPYDGLANRCFKPLSHLSCSRAALAFGSVLKISGKESPAPDFFARTRSVPSQGDRPRCGVPTTLSRSESRRRTCFTIAIPGRPTGIGYRSKMMLYAGVSDRADVGNFFE